MKTHDELGISAAELAALIEVRDYLRGAGREAFVPEDEWDDEEGEGLVFNMGATCGAFECGSVACIGGSAALVMAGRHLEQTMFLSGSERNAASSYVDKHRIRFASDYEAASGIRRLFYPMPISDWDAIRPDVAAEAIDRFVETGDPGWIEIAKEREIRLHGDFR